MNRLLIAGWSAALIALLPLTTLALPQDATHQNDVDALRHGGHVLLIRHGAVEAVVDEPIPLDLADCAVQRMLSIEGRAQARQIGEGLRSLDIPVGHVLSSGYCRTVYTALLAFGRAQLEEGLLSRDYVPVPGVSATAQFEERTEAVRRLLGTRPPLGTNTILVTHGEVIRAAVGFELAMGEAAIFRPDGQDGFDSVTRIMASEWAS